MVVKELRVLLLWLLVALFVGCTNEPESNIPDGDYINRTEEFGELGGWKFRCKVYGEAQTVADNGGQVEFLKKVDQLLADASEYFQVGGINDEGANQVHFYMTEFVEFEGPSREVMMLDESEVADSFDLRLVVNTHAAEDDLAEGWLGEPYLAIGHTHQRTWGANAVGELVVNLARSRGVTPLNGGEIDIRNNAIAKVGFEADECVTNDPFHTHEWSDYAKSVINQAADRRVAKPELDYLPSDKLNLRVLTPEGAIAKGAQMELYPIYDGSGEVSTKSIYKGTMNSAGNMVFFKNPFTDEAPDDDDRQIVNYFVVINYEDTQGYGWMPLYEVLAAGAKGEKEYVRVLQLTGNEGPIPGQDYILRKKEYEKLGGWKFRCRVFGEKQTVKDHGGRIEFMKKVDRFMADVSAHFQVPGINDAGGNEVHFFMIDFQEFSGPISNSIYRTDGVGQPDFDFRMYINGHSPEGDTPTGWLGPPYMNVSHNFGDLFTGWAIDAIAHECGHYRGVPDLYASEVHADKNPINGEAHESITCMMNYPYGLRHWSEYALLLINKSADKRVGVDANDYFPNGGTEVVVVDQQGAPVEGATIKFYPVYPYSYTVTEQPLYEGTTDVAGCYDFGEVNPFFKPGTHDNIVNYLVEVVHNGVKYYEWMPMHEAQTVGCKDIDDTYVKTFTLK